MPVGDINSDARGSGARYNDGKPNLSLIPLALIAGTIPQIPAEDDTALAREQIVTRLVLSYLGNFQTTRNVTSLDAALSLLSPYWEETARVFEYGLKKYAAWNWAKGMDWSVPLACAGRHALAIMRGEGYDPLARNGSGLRHIGHLACNVVMLRVFADTYPEGDDLPPRGMFEPPKPAEPADPEPRVGYATVDNECDCSRCCPTSAHAYQTED